MQITYIRPVAYRTHTPSTGVSGLLSTDYEFNSLGVLAQGAEPADFEGIVGGIRKRKGGGCPRIILPDGFTGFSVDSKTGDLDLSGVKRIAACFEDVNGTVAVKFMADKTYFEIARYKRLPNEYDQMRVQTVSKMNHPNYLQIDGRGSGAYDVLWTVLHHNNIDSELIDGESDKGRLLLLECLGIPMADEDAATVSDLLAQKKNR